MIAETISDKWKDYELIDSGNFEKLERFGRYTMIRPEPKALWDKALSRKEWERTANVEFVPGAGFARAGKEDSGVWTILKKMPEQWQVDYDCHTSQRTYKLKMRLGLTAFKHVGIFPEQAPNWDYISSQVERLKGNAAGFEIRNDSVSDNTANPESPDTSVSDNSPRPKILNLFAYTGAASLAACAAGADVTHVDAVRQVVTWAHRNMELSGLDGIRWIVEDVMKFVNRQVRRKVRYNGIILDPPAYGRGADGERWKLDESLFRLLKECAKILAPANSFLLLNLYSNGYSSMLADTLVSCAFGNEGRRTSGEMTLKDSFGRKLPLNVFTRLER